MTLLHAILHVLGILGIIAGSLLVAAVIVMIIIVLLIMTSRGNPFQ